MADVAGEQAPRRFKVAGEGLELTITLDAKWQARPFQQAVALPFVKKFNSQQREGGRQLSVEALCGVQIDGAGLSRVADAGLAAAGLVVPPAASRVELTFGESPPTELRLRVACGDVSVKLTLDKRWLGKTVAEAVVKPFLSVYNRRQPTATPPRTPEQALAALARARRRPHDTAHTHPRTPTPRPHSPTPAHTRPHTHTHAHTRTHAHTPHASGRGDPRRRRKAAERQGGAADGPARGARLALHARRPLLLVRGGARGSQAAADARPERRPHLDGRLPRRDGAVAVNGGLSTALSCEQADYREATELLWTHRKLNKADGAAIARSFTAASPLRKLKYLYLYGNSLGDEGLAALAPALRQTGSRPSTPTLTHPPTLPLRFPPRGPPLCT